MATTTSTLNSSLVAALGELRNIAKDKINPHFKSRFTSLDAILDATRPVLAKHGLALSQEPVFEDGMAGVVTRIIHAGGESRESKLLLPLRDQSAQGVGSCLSYARRYAAAAVLGIASDEDDDGQVASTPAKAVIAKPAFKAQVGGQDAREAMKPAPVAAPAQAAPAGVTETLFKLMDDNKISETDLLSFVESKGMKAPSYVADLSIPAMKRLTEIFTEVVAFTFSK
jgi:hypothetical protein